MIFMGCSIANGQIDNPPSQYIEPISEDASFPPEYWKFNSAFNPKYWKNKKPFQGYWQQDVFYKIKATLDDNAETISGSEQLIYTNNSPNTLTEAYFHLYQNSFQPASLTHELYQINKTKVTYGPYESRNLGTIITSFVIDNDTVEFSLDRTILKVKFLKPLKPGKHAIFNINFITFFDRGSVRRRMKVYDHHGVKHFNGVHWYPRICVYDRKFTWKTSQHLEKEFYGDYGIFDVELNLPEHYIVEATGELMNANQALPPSLRSKIDLANFANKPIDETPSIIIPPSKSLKTWHFIANNVHDFAWTADPSYRIGEVEWKGIKCVAIAQENNAKGWQGTAKYLAEVIKVYSNDFGLYEYPKIVAADAADGMEYPMITLDGGYYPSHQSLIAHEVGHNWFFGMVGSNETYRAALDEGFTQFLTAWCLRKLTRQPMPEFSSVYNGYMQDAIDGEDATLNTHSNEFNSAIGHGGGYKHVYFKTATMLYNLQYFLGDSVFLAAMKNYVSAWKFCHPYVEDFRNSIIQSSQADLNKFFDQWFETKASIDYGIKSVKKIQNSTYQIVIQRYGDLVMPVNIDIFSQSVDPKTGQMKYDVLPITIPVNYYEHPDRINAKPWIGWDRLSPTYTLEITMPNDGVLKQAWIDPTGRLADINRVNNKWKDRVHWDLDLGNGQNENYLGEYNLLVRPALSYSGISGLMAGFRTKGQYAGRKHQIDIAFYVSPFHAHSSKPNILYPSYNQLYSYDASWKHDVKGGGQYQVRSLTFNNVMAHKFGWNMRIQNHTFGLEGKFIHPLIAQLAYPNLLTKDLPPYYSALEGYIRQPSAWSLQTNVSLNLFWKINFSGWGKSGDWEFKTRLPSPWSQVQFGYIQSTLNYHLPIGKSMLHFRLFGQLGTGSNPAPESALYASAANPEEYLDHRIARDFGTINFSPNLYNSASPAERLYPLQYLHLSGGLNLRGYYLLPMAQVHDGNNLAFYRGHSGTSVNIEWEFTKLFGKFLNLKIIQLQPYFFADAGILGLDYQSVTYWSKPIMDAGLGTMVNLKIPPGKRILTEVPKLRLRFDFPFFLNQIPQGSNFVQMRFKLGIERLF